MPHTHSSSTLNLKDMTINNFDYIYNINPIEFSNDEE